MCQNHYRTEREYNGEKDEARNNRKYYDSERVMRLFRKVFVYGLVASVYGLFQGDYKLAFGAAGISFIGFSCNKFFVEDQ